MRAPLVVNTADGTCWTRRAVTRGGLALYAMAGVCDCPEYLMATEAELAEHGIVGSADVLPVPVGPESRSRSVLDRARDALGARMAKGDLRLVLENTIAYAAGLEAERHSTNEALDDAVKQLRTDRDRIAELEAAPVTVYRAEHSDAGITLGHYGTATAAREHCETTERRSWPTGTTFAFDWIEDDEDRVAELVVTAGQNEESTTGYIVTALELDSEYDAEADE